MQNLWNDAEAAPFINDPLKLRVYTSRLLGREPSLVLHGGGNTSAKIQKTNLFGETESLLYVKGSGWDLATIEAQGFAPVRMETLLKLAGLEKLTDSDMVREQKSAMIDPGAPAPSVEAILHAIIPFTYVDHTHADAVVAISNTPDGEKLIQDILGDRVLYIPYVMPGFVLARKVYEMTRDVDWKKYEGMVLQHHGIFSFADDARQSYERMIALVSKAEDYIKNKGAFDVPTGTVRASEDLKTLATLRRAVSKKLGAPAVVRVDASPQALAYGARPDLSRISQQGPLTPDHVIHTKSIPLLLKSETSSDQIGPALDAYEAAYRSYFDRNSSHFKEAKLKCLDPAPRWAVWSGHGILSMGPTAKRADVVADIIRHTMRAQQWSQAIGGWTALPERDLFEVEYWELEQAKLKKGGACTPPLQGKIAVVTGAAGGIGKACVDALRAQGAAVLALDIAPAVTSNWKGSDVTGLVCDVSDSGAVNRAIDECVRRYGGLDIVVANAGIFPSSKNIDSLDDETWKRTIDINLTGQMYLFRATAPYLALGIDPAIVVVASKNVPAPGPGAAAYSASKAAATQLARVAALELGPKGVRVNMLHPHAVMDTGLWTPEVLEGRAKHYKMSVEEYKRNNLLKVEVCSKDVADLVCAMAGPLFGKTTGAQVAVDGGNDRVI